MSEHGRILIVDDDTDFSESTAAFLRARGYEVAQAYNGLDGLRQARLDAPDLILMDVMMGERTEGFFTVQRLRRDQGLSRIPVVVVSSLFEDDPSFGIEPERGWLAHDAFLPKPLNLDALLATVKEQMQAAAARGSS
jgi:CheY-like chemotaxis protein